MFISKKPKRLLVSYCKIFQNVSNSTTINVHLTRDTYNLKQIVLSKPDGTVNCYQYDRKSAPSVDGTRRIWYRTLLIQGQP